MKLYKYRPLSEFLYKELNYQELFFASYKELNDPLDLSAKLEFSTSNKDDIDYLLWFIIKSTIKRALKENKITENEYYNQINYLKDIETKNIIKDLIFNIVSKNTPNRIWLNDIIKLLIGLKTDLNLNFSFNTEALKDELNRLTAKFLENSYTTCFTENYDNYLMWSHYASSHSGICIEFSIENENKFPFFVQRHRKSIEENYTKSLTKWTLDETIYLDNIYPVSYIENQPFINFFEFFPAFENENDCDLIGLSKSWTHKYALELINAFSSKTQEWQYEKEWRAIQINFGETLFPESRIRYYPIETITGIYFGIKTPEIAKQRIANIFNKYKSNISFYEGSTNGTTAINFKLNENFNNND